MRRSLRTMFTALAIAACPCTCGTSTASPAPRPPAFRPTTAHQASFTVKAMSCHGCDAYKLEHVISLYDPDGVTLELYDTNASALSVFVDKDRKIVRKLHSDDRAALGREIENALRH